MNDFTCERCLQNFKKKWSEEEAEKEYSTAPWNIPGKERGVICDDCFQEFKVWFESLSEEDHKRIRNE